MKHKIYKIIYNYTRILIKHIYIYICQTTKIFLFLSYKNKNVGGSEKNTL